MAIEGSTGKVYNPKLKIAGGDIPFGRNHPMHFQGGTIQVLRNPSLAKQAISTKLASLLKSVDEVPVTRKQKLKLFRLGICPRLSWDLTISEFSAKKTLDAMVNQYFQKWSGLARAADQAKLFLPQANGGFSLSLPSELYQNSKSAKLAS